MGCVFSCHTSLPKVDRAVSQLYDKMEKGTLLVVVCQGALTLMVSLMAKRTKSRWDANSRERLDTISGRKRDRAQSKCLRRTPLVWLDSSIYFSPGMTQELMQFCNAVHAAKKSFLLTWRPASRPSLRPLNSSCGVWTGACEKPPRDYTTARKIENIGTVMVYTDNLPTSVVLDRWGCWIPPNSWRTPWCWFAGPATPATAESLRQQFRRSTARTRTSWRWSPASASTGCASSPPSSGGKTHKQ